MVTAAGDAHPNIMTLTWTMVLDWSPRFALCTGPWNYTYQAMMKSGECVITIPTVELANQVLQVGTHTSQEIDKFSEFGLTSLPAVKVDAPLVSECYANLECKVVDRIKTQNIVILECVKAWIDGSVKDPRFLHAIGDGRFTVDGKTLNLRQKMLNKLPPGI